MKILFMMLLFATPILAQDPATITQAELLLRTQSLFDAIVPGDRAPWQQYLAEDAIIHDEKGGAYTKATFLETVVALPTGYSGSIKVTHPQSLFAPGVAIFSYDADEVETVFGNRMTARYHQIDTWLYRNRRWQIAATQAMRYYEDPASMALSPQLLREYAGVYEIAPGHQITITTRDGKLFTQRAGGQPVEMLAEAPDLFFRPAVEGRRLFRRNSKGSVDAMIDRRNNEDMLWQRIH